MCFQISVIILVLLLHTVRAQNRPTVSVMVSSEVENLQVEIGLCENQFICGLTQTPTSISVDCIDPDFFCNGNIDCTNGVDEHDCPTMCEHMVICPDMKTCANPCDGVSTCPGGEDEDMCPPKCNKNQLLCSDHMTCGNICDQTQDCPGGEDELRCAPVCPPGQVLCADGSACVNPCNNVFECPHGGDERDCPFQCNCTAGQYICKSSDKCLNRNQVCQAVVVEAAADSCLRGSNQGDDESDSAFGFKCMN